MWSNEIPWGFEETSSHLLIMRCVLIVWVSVRRLGHLSDYVWYIPITLDVFRAVPWVVPWTRRSYMICYTHSLYRLFRRDHY